LECIGSPLTGDGGQLTGEGSLLTGEGSLLTMESGLQTRMLGELREYVSGITCIMTRMIYSCLREVS